MKTKLGGMLLSFLVVCSIFSTTKAEAKMKLNAGIVTAKLQESKKFYVEKLGLKIRFENDFYVLLHTGGTTDTEISFLLPEHPTQHALFQKPFVGPGVFITIEVDNVDDVYQRVKSQGVPIAFEMRDEAWGDRHFAVVDPNGIGIDFVTHTSPQ